MDLDTLAALESYLDEFKGVLIVVSHDRFFTDKVTKHLFIFEGNGSVKDYLGSLSDYAECLIEQESRATSTDGTDFTDNKQISYKEDKKVRMEKKNSIKTMKRDMENIEKKIEKLKIESAKLEVEIEVSSDKGWSFLADLTDKLNIIQAEIIEKETKWLEIAEVLEAED